MKKIHILENALRYLLDEGRNAEKAKQKTIAVMKSYLSQNGIQGGQLEAMAMEYENSFKEWLFHANMPDSVIRLEPIMANVAMQIGFTPQNKNTRELYRLQDITNYIIANYNKEDFPIALNKLTLDNTTFESLNELFGSAIDASKGIWKPSNDGKPKPHYTVKRLDNFEEANEYYPYTQDICYLGDDVTWDNYTDEGQNAVYVLLRDGWEDIPAEHGKDTPYDDYGKSMVFVIIRPNGDVAYTNTRWNHDTDGNGPRNVDQSFTDNMNDVSDMLQTDYQNVLKPYSEEELAEKGVITLSTVRRWIEEGKDVLELCYYEQLSDNLFVIDISQEISVLYNSNLKKIMPSNDTILKDVEAFREGYAAIQRTDEKWTLINTYGEQICGWFKEVGGFHNGFSTIQREDGKESLINTASQQICDWYRNILPFVNGFAPVRGDNGKWSFINTDGQRICGWYYYVESFQNGFANIMREDKKWSFINTQGQQIGDWYQMAYPFCNGFAIIKQNYMYSFINTDGQRIGGWYNNATNFVNDFASVQREDGKWSFINTDGQRIGGWYNKVGSFYDGLGGVQLDDGKWYHIDIYGNLYDYKTKQPISPQNESYTRLNNLIAEALYNSISKYLLYN